MAIITIVIAAVMMRMTATTPPITAVVLSVDQRRECQCQEAVLWSWSTQLGL